MNLSSRILVFLSWFVLIHTYETQNELPKVVIVGAGAAGISAASKLLDNGGFDITILEAEAQYGGRIRNLYENNYYKALGAEWTPANDENIVYRMLKKHNAINKNWTPKPGLYAKSNGDALLFEEFQPYIDVLRNVSDDLCAEIKSEDDFYEKAFARIENNEFDSNLGRNLPKFMNISIHYPCDYDKKGSHVETPLKGDPKQPVRGMMSVLDVLMGVYPNKEVPEIWQNIIKLRQKVTKIDYGNKRPEVFVLDMLKQSETKIVADYVIVTVPLGVLKVTHLNLFSPQLPQTHQNAINALKFGVENNIYFTFENQWWPLGYDLFVIWTKNDVKNLSQEDKWLSRIEGFVPVEDAPAVLAIHNMELENSSSENLSDTEVSHKIMMVLRNAFGNLGWNITDPIRVDHSRWGTNPHFYGSVTYKGVEAYNANATNSDLCEEIKNDEGIPVLFIAGEATHDKFSGSVHGAVESGFNVALKIIKMYE